MAAERVTLLHELLVRAAALRPAHVAVRAVDGAITYAELDALAEVLALRLRGCGVVAGDRVGVWLDKSVLALASLQACLRLGAAYVPLDPLSPRPRIQTIADDASLRVVVTDAARASGLDAATLVLELGEPAWRALLSAERTPPQVGADTEPGALAYILYTSGSTGVPKGVCISHRNALAFIDWAVDTLALGPDDVLSGHAPLHFDLSVLDVYGTFAAAATLCLLSELVARSPTQAVELGRRESISVWYSVPAALIMMMQEGRLLERDDWQPRVVCFAGESFPITPLRALRRHWPRARMLNLYGPTETNVCTAYELGELADDRTTPVPIGRATCGNRVWVDEHGELFVDGPTVMLGYWGRAPQQGPYATGDIVRVEADGNLVFVGRRDHMVKIRGHRIELGEIEATLATHPHIAEVAVVIAGEGLDAKLIACVVAAGQPPGLLALKRLCAGALPPYMIIDRLRLLDALPRTRNGKIDRQALQSM